MSVKQYKDHYLFISIHYKDRLVKFSAVTNIESFRQMMKSRYPDYEIINDNRPFKYTHESRLHNKIMDKLSDCRVGTQGEFRTYDLDSYRVRTVIRLLCNTSTKVIGHDVLICQSCTEEFIGDYGMIYDIWKFLNADLRYCSDNCLPQVTRPWSSGQRYCKCGVIFYPSHNTDFYCKRCLNSV